MIAPYFNVWLGLRKEEDSMSSTVEGFLDAWRIMKLPTRIVTALFFAMDLAMIAFSVAAALDASLLSVYVVCLILLSALAVGADRVATSFHRTNPELSATRNAEFAKRLRVELRKVGLTNTVQVEYARDEAVRLLERKERRGASVVRYAFDGAVLLALASSLNLSIGFLEHDAPLDSVLLFVGAAAFVSVSFVFLVYLFWRMCDRIGPYPVPKLREFVDDLAALLVYEAGSSIRYRGRQSRARERRVFQRA